jgi:predicted transcriptional regulator
MLIHEYIRIKKENERYINEISLELNEWYEESKKNGNLKFRIRVSKVSISIKDVFLKVRIHF